MNCDDAGRFWKQRRAYEKKWRDPDDVYIDVEQREEERKKQGLPPRIGIVPYAAVADEEKRIEEEQEQKKQRPIERPKPKVNAKSAVRGGAMTKKRRGQEAEDRVGGSTPITPITDKESRSRQGRRQISDSIEDGRLFFSVAFMDKTTSLCAPDV